MKKYPVVLAIVPKSFRLAIAVFHGKHLAYYRICTLSQRQNRLIKVRSLTEYFIQQHCPDYLVIESLIYVQQQTKGLLAVNEEIIKAAENSSTKIISFSPAEVRASFVSNERTNKLKVANVLIALYPELNALLNYQSRSPQQYGLLIFNAVALGLFAVRTVCSAFNKTI